MNDKTKKKRKALAEESALPSEKPKKKKRLVDGTGEVKPKLSPEEKAARKLARKDAATAKFGRRKDRLEESLEALDLERISQNLAPGERDILEEYVWLFNRTGRLIRRMEEQALRTGQSRDIYALSTLISQQREIIADIRTLTDLSTQTDLIKRMVMQPMANSLAQNLMDSYYQLRRLLSEVTNPKDTQFALNKLDDIVKEQSKFLQSQYSEGSVKVDRIMAGEDVGGLDGAPTGKKKKRKKRG